MVAIDVLEGFEHQVPSSLTVGVPASSGTPIYGAATLGGTLTYTTGRLGGQALHVVESGSTNFRQDWPASTTRVFYGWFRVPAAPSFDRSAIIVLSDSGGVQAAIATVRSSANGSTIEMQCGTGTRRAGPNISDNAWHLLEFRFIGATTSWTVDWAVDGSAQTQATFTGAAANTTTRLSYGSTSASHTCTVDWDDVVGSVTSGDYQIGSSVTGSFAVRPYVPNAEGTDVIGSSNAITFTGASTGWECVDEWPADDTTYITYASTTTGDAASNYAELALPNLESDVTAVWAVRADAALFANGTGLDVLKVQALDSSNNVLAEVTDTSFDVSETTLRYWRKMLTTPGGGFLTDFAGLKFRVGLSTDTNAIPRASALMLQAAVLISTNAAPTTTTVVTSATFPSPTEAATAAHTTTTVASVAAVYAPTVAAGAAITTTTIAAVAAIPTPTVVGNLDADVTTASVGVTASLPAVTTEAEARASPASITVLLADIPIPTPTVAAAAAVTTSTVVDAASVPAPTASVNIPITTATVAALASVPAPTVAATAAITTTTVARSASIPAPTVVAATPASVTTTTIAATAAIPAPTISASAAITPARIACTRNIPTIHAAAGASAAPLTVARTAAVPVPTQTATALTTPSTVAAGAILPAPVAAVSVGATTTTVAVVATVEQPGVSWTADSVSVTASVPVPSIRADANVTTASAFAAAASVPDAIGAIGSIILLDPVVTAAAVHGIGSISVDTVGTIYKVAGSYTAYHRAGTYTASKTAGSLEVVKRAGSDPDIEKRGSA